MTKTLARKIFPVRVFWFGADLIFGKTLFKFRMISSVEANILAVFQEPELKKQKVAIQYDCHAGL
jgi:hypothetical protein